MLDARGNSPFEIFQEALTNVTRHAQASIVQLRLHRSGAAVIAHIEDDSRDFDVQHVFNGNLPKQGIGLLGMRNLVALLAAQLNLVWLYREPAGHIGATVEPSDDHLAPPSPAEMAALLDLAMQDALPRLKQRALQIEQLGEQYRPFIERLCQLVDEFDEDQLLALIERYRTATD